MLGCSLAAALAARTGRAVGSTGFKGLLHDLPPILAVAGAHARRHSTAPTPPAAALAAPAPDCPTPPPPAPPALDFNDAAAAFASKSTPELARTAAIMAACTFGPFVARADRVLAGATALLGPTLTAAAVRHTFFRHFCAGEDVDEAVGGTVVKLREAGIRGIVNYAAEDVVTAGTASLPPSAADGPVDARLRTFLESVAATDNATDPGFVAVKVTALGPPDLLERASALLVESGAAGDRGAHRNLRGLLAPGLSAAERAAWDAMEARLAAVADACAAKGNMRLIVDAEQTWLQPAIDALTINLMRSHNAGPARASAGRTLVLNSYQCYLRDGPARVAADGARAEAEGWTHGAKAVRGAYIVSERMRAAAAGDPDPIWPTIQATHTAYDGTVGRLLDAVAGGRAEVMVASHNQASIEAAVAGMAARGLGPRGAPVYFGQLLGMADHLTYTLGGAGYRAHKIVPYGPVQECLLYLVRRAQENADVLGGARREAAMLRGELLRRAGAALGVAIGGRGGGAGPKTAASA